VLKHEYFEELCMVAAVGQASPEELAELEEHASECNVCRQEYAECLDLASWQFAANEKHPELSPQEVESCLNTERFAQRFFKRAEKEGIVFSQGAAKDSREVPPPILSFRRRSSRRILVFAAAAAMLVTAVSTAYFVKTTDSRKSRIALADPDANTGPSSLDLSKNLADLRNTNLQLESQLQGLAAKLNDTDSRLRKTNADLNSTIEDRDRMSTERDALNAQFQEVQKKLADSEALVAAAQRQSTQSRDRADELQASFAADQSRIQELTSQLGEKSAVLDRERQLLAVGHDVNDLMGARNLHIVDVVDTDPHGKNRTAFGRIFFTEGKSLVFYAYDLNDAKIEKASYQYRIWSKKEGQDAQVQNLGIFYSDDKAQRRWVFKCNDPKVLNAIDSVFVTLEPPNSNPAHPKGSNLMYAYLRGQPNHP
jgi:hypothetical protein